MNPFSDKFDSCQGEAGMFLAATTLCAAVLLTVLFTQRIRDRREMERHGITPEALHTLMETKLEVFVFDVRQLLDLLGDSVIIPV